MQQYYTQSHSLAASLPCLNALILLAVFPAVKQDVVKLEPSFPGRGQVSHLGLASITMVRRRNCSC